MSRSVAARGIVRAAAAVRALDRLRLLRPTRRPQLTRIRAALSACGETACPSAITDTHTERCTHAHARARLSPEPLLLPLGKLLVSGARS